MSTKSQPLDLLTFGLMKRHFSASRFSRVGNPSSDMAVRMLGGRFESSAPHHNIEAFMSPSWLESVVDYLSVQRDTAIYSAVSGSGRRHKRGAIVH
jgi:hypothetical protein